MVVKSKISAGNWVSAQVLSTNGESNTQVWKSLLKRLKELEGENTNLKRMYSIRALQLEMAKNVISSPTAGRAGKWQCLLLCEVPLNIYMKSATRANPRYAERSIYTEADFVTSA